MKIGIIFDLDGTLLDTLDDLHSAANYALEQFSCPLRSREEVRRFVGNGAGELIRQALPGGENDPPQEAVLAVFRAYYQAHCQDRTDAYPGIRQALAELGAEYPLAVVSNKPDPAVKSLCSQYFGPLFALGEQPGIPRKPAPDMVFRAMETMGLDRCIYVGDSEVDVETARRGEIPCLSVTWGFRDREVLEQAGAVHFCDEPAQMADQIRAIAEKIK